MHPRLALIPLCLAALALTACEREKKPDPFAVPGAMRLQVEYLTLPEAEARLKALPEGKTLAQIEDPCGQAAGPDGASVAWVRAELVKTGHDPKTFCDILLNPTAHIRKANDESVRTTEQLEADLIASRARLALMQDNSALTHQATEAALKIINRAPRTSRS